ncbi:MAG: threonylcarbamoyl-AMP synthase [Clostridia bacterium]|nr:threonylcarbamoyl-AMP synthase [Clostridia bacterium]
MDTKILHVSGDLSNPRDINNLKIAADVVRNGGLVAFPTETVYGLGANALDGEAVKKIFEVKGRPQDNPLISHLASAEDISKYAYTDDNKYFDKIAQLFPAPLTVILRKRPEIPTTVTAGLPNAGFRIPENLVARKFIELAGVPIAAPSANISGKPSPTKAEHVIEDLFGKVDVIIDGGPCNVGVESTIVSLATEPPVLLRPGAVTLETLSLLLGQVQISRSILSEMNDDETAAAPGMKYKHYAPASPVTLIMGNDEKAIAYINKRCETENLAILCYDEDVSYITECRNVFTIGKAGDPMQQARSIFDALRATDECSFITGVIARCPESKDGVNLAIYNRLLKASGFNVIKL